MTDWNQKIWFCYFVFFADAILEHGSTRKAAGDTEALLSFHCYCHRNALAISDLCKCKVP